MTILSLPLLLLAMIALCMAMDRHHDQVLKGRPSARFRLMLRGSGWALLLLSIAPCVVARGWSIGLTWWLGLQAVAATTLVMLLSYRPKSVPAVAIAMPVIAIGQLVLRS